ncbi:hypothetical protein PMAYCL1PPCAC_01033, partial [Pristionchus mayeri]
EKKEEEKKEKEKEEEKKDHREGSDEEEDEEKMTIECPICRLLFRTASGWYGHLKAIHNTTPKEAGYALRCDCGHESLSKEHSEGAKSRTSRCFYARSSRPGASPLPTEARPATARAFTAHLKLAHPGHTLDSMRKEIVCGCGAMIISHNSHIRKHPQIFATTRSTRCDRRSEGRSRRRHYCHLQSSRISKRSNQLSDSFPDSHKKLCFSAISSVNYSHYLRVIFYTNSSSHFALSIYQPLYCTNFTYAIYFCIMLIRRYVMILLYIESNF